MKTPTHRNCRASRHHGFEKNAGLLPTNDGRLTSASIISIADIEWGMTTLLRIGALDVAGAIAARIGSYVDMNFIQFLAVEGDKVICCYMNSGGEGPTFEIELHKVPNGWFMTLEEYPPGTEQEVEMP